MREPFAFFASNAGLTIVILALIIIFLLKERLGFFPGYRRELQIYRTAGLEFVDISRKNLTAHEQLSGVLNRSYYAEINGKCAAELLRSQEASALLNAYTDQVGATRDLVLNNSQIESNSPSAILVALKTNYEKQKSKALSSLPKTPHLTATERENIIEALRIQAINATEHPLLVASLAADFSSAQQKNSEPLQAMRGNIDIFESAAAELASLVSEMTESVTATKAKIQEADLLENDRRTLLAAAANTKDLTEREKLTAEAKASLAEKPDVEAPMRILLKRLPACIQAHLTLKQSLRGIIEKFPENLSQPESSRLLKVAHKAFPIFIADLEATPFE